MWLDEACCRDGQMRRSWLEQTCGNARRHAALNTIRDRYQSAGSARGFAAQIGGAVTLDFAPSGLRCRIRVPGSDSRGMVSCIRPSPLTGTGAKPAGAQTVALPGKAGAGSLARLAINQPDRLPDPGHGRGG
jgi:hypothetical protein